jgi:hypothetical protein
MSFLAVVALLMDGVMLYRACPDTSASFCDLPFVSHWMCHAFRNVMVQLSFWTCSFVLDEVRMAPTVPFVWSILLALPPLSQAVFLASAIFGKSPNYGLLGGAEVIGAVVTIVMLVKLHKQKQFGVVQREKPKNQ